MVADLVRTWVAGWALSRGTPPPGEKPWGFAIDVPGSTHEVHRYVLPVVEESLVRSAAASATLPRTWMRMPAEPDHVEPWLPQGWAVDRTETGHLMATDLTATHPVTPRGYTAVFETVGGVVHVRMLDAAGLQAAKGQMAFVGEAVVVDKVLTEETHRRRGLGAFVMRALADRAVDGGAVVGILGASDAGRALYETLGWKKHSTIAECVYLP